MNDLTEFLRALEALCLRYNIALTGNDDCEVVATIVQDPVFRYSLYDGYAEIW